MNHRFGIALGLAALLGAAAVQAQDQQFAAVPFAFEVAGKQVQAGTYSTMRQINGILVVRNSQTSERVFLVPMLTGHADTDKSSLTFERYGSVYFLRKVQFGREGTIYEVLASKHEKELAKAEHREEVLVAVR